MHWSKKSLFALALDLLLIAIAWSLAFWLRFNLDTPDDFQAMMLQTLHARSNGGFAHGMRNIKAFNAVNWTAC